MIFYEIIGDSRLFCEWKRVKGNEKFSRIVCDFIKKLPGWQNSFPYAFKRLSSKDDPVKWFNIYFIQGGDISPGIERKRIAAQCHVAEYEGETMEREEFCKAVDGIFKNQQLHIRQFFKDFARDPETTDAEVNDIMNLILEKESVAPEN